VGDLPDLRQLERGDAEATASRPATEPHGRSAVGGQCGQPGDGARGPAQRARLGSAVGVGAQLDPRPEQVHGLHERADAVGHAVVQEQEQAARASLPVA